MSIYSLILNNPNTDAQLPLCASRYIPATYMQAVTTATPNNTQTTLHEAKHNNTTSLTKGTF